MKTIARLICLLFMLFSLPALAQQTETEWETIRPGMERRVYLPDDSPGVSLMALRIDPARYEFRAHYTPGERLSSGQWLLTTPGAVAFINANFFNSERMIVDGLLVSDGRRYGSAYQGYGGMFTVRDGEAHVTLNAEQPYRGAALDQAVEGSPALVLAGDPNPQSDLWWRDEQARRTVIAEDSEGRILFIITAYGGSYLEPLSQFLAAADMDIVNAVNLDGGVSTTLYMQPEAGTSPYLITAVEPVAAILAVYPR